MGPVLIYKQCIRELPYGNMQPHLISSVDIEWVQVFLRIYFRHHHSSRQLPISAARDKAEMSVGDAFSWGRVLARQ